MEVGFSCLCLSRGVFCLFPLPFNLIINVGIAGSILSDCSLKTTLIFLSFTGKRVSLWNSWSTFGSFPSQAACWKPVISANSKQKYGSIGFYTYVCRLHRSCPMQDVWAIKWEMLHVMQGAATFIIQIPLARLILLLQDQNIFQTLIYQLYDECLYR